MQAGNGIASERLRLRTSDGDGEQTNVQQQQPWWCGKRGERKINLPVNNYISPT